MLSALIINGRRIPEATRESARMLFVDSKAPIRASARRDQWTDRSIDRSIDRSNALYMYTQVRYVFGQSGRREVAEGEGGGGGALPLLCPAGTVTLLPVHGTVANNAFSRQHTPTLAHARPPPPPPPPPPSRLLCTYDARVLVAIDTDQIPKILRQPERTRPRAPHRDACCARCRPTKLSADFAPSTLRCTTSAERCHALDIASAGSPLAESSGRV